jgi:hypothetical protein
MGLALSGCTLQAVTGNPLAEPGILGINAGAGFAAMLMLTLFPALHIDAMLYQPLFAMAGAYWRPPFCTALPGAAERSAGPSAAGRHWRFGGFFGADADHGL